jgi:hypothetical protein
MQNFFNAQHSLSLLRSGIGIFICLLLTGCGELDIGPRPGLWYRNKTTDEEIRIEIVGRGDEVYEFCSRSVSLSNRAKRAFLGYDEIQIMYNPGCANRLCVAYEVLGDPEQKRPTYIHIIPAKEIWTNYQRIARRN